MIHSGDFTVVSSILRRQAEHVKLYPNSAVGRYRTIKIFKLERRAALAAARKFLRVEGAET